MITFRSVLLGLAKTVAVIAVSAGIGIVLGVGLSRLRAGHDDASAQAGSRVPVTARPAFRVMSADFALAHSREGRRRARARVSLRLWAKAGGDTLQLESPVLIVGRRRQARDPAAGGAAALLQPIAPGDSARGLLRYEITGSTTRALRRRRSATLSLGPATMQVHLTAPG